MADETPKGTVRAILNDVWLRSFNKNIYGGAWVVDGKSIQTFVADVPIKLMESGLFPLVKSLLHVVEIALEVYVLGKKPFSGRLAYAERIVAGIEAEVRDSVAVILAGEINPYRVRTVKDADKQALLDRLTEAICALHLIHTKDLLGGIFNALEGIDRYYSEQRRLERAKEKLTHLFP